jgi:GNAT superfamily N-acetyltransferase
MSLRIALDVRPYSDKDELAVLELLDASLGGGPAGSRSPAFFRWKHVSNPFGRSYAILAEHGDRVVGFRTFMRWRFVVDGTPVSAVRAVDTATHPDYQGQGIFRRLTLAAIDELRADTDLVFNTPNEQSLPGYLKMGWQRVTDVSIQLRIRRPLRFARGVRSLDELHAEVGTAPTVSAPTAASVLADGDAMAPLLPAARPGQLATDRSVDYLRWRYGEAPLLDYRAVAVGDRSRPDSIAIFRVRPRGRLWETTVAEVLTVPGDVWSARRALTAAARAAVVDHVTCSLPSGSEARRGLRRAGFMPSPEGLTLVANPLRPMPVDPLRPSTWAFALGDLEVF